ncbi:MAG: hypothetical protein ACYS5V_14065 [Planctomycetota bacterium]|jgi:hypothetical protein
MLRSWLQGLLTGVTDPVEARQRHPAAPQQGAAQLGAAGTVLSAAPAAPKAQWQSAAGRRLLTPAEEAARDRYFRSKFAAAMAGFGAAGRRRRLHPSAA